MTRGFLRCALPAACALSASLAVSSPALALKARGHVPAFSFAAAGAARAMAIDEATGHVYVSLAPGSQPGCALGCVEELEVSPGSPVGSATVVRTLEVPDPGPIAVDNAAGSPSHDDVYVAGTTRKAVKEEEPEAKIVYKFPATGNEPIVKLKKFKLGKAESEAFEPIEGLAVDSTGKLLVYDEEAVIARFNSAEKNKSLFSIEGAFATPTPGLAVDSQGNLYVGHESENAGAEGPAGEPAVIGKCEIVEVEKECEALISELGQEPSTGVAVNSANEVFLVGNATVKGEKTTSLVAFTSEGAQIQRVVASHVKEGDAIAVNSASGAIYISDASSSTVEVFEPEPAGAPRVDSFSACITTQCKPEAAAVRLTALVDPSGADTHAYFEYGTSSCATLTCEKIGEKDLGAGFGDQEITAELGALHPGVTYHFRVVASNANGSLTSTEKTVTVPGTAISLPDGRAWEQVTPPQKNGYEPEPILGSGGLIQASADGNAITYTADGPIHCEGEPEGSLSPEPAQIFAVRGSSWGCRDLSTANSVSPGTNIGVAPQEFNAFTPDLSLSLLEPFPGPEEVTQWASPPLSPPVSAEEKKRHEEGKPYQEKTIYLHNDAPLQPEASSAEEQKNYAAAEQNGKLMGNAGFLALVTEANALGVLEKPPGCEEGLCFGGGKNADLEVVTATPDLGHVLFRSLKASAKERPEGELYEWSGEQVQLVSRLPKNAQGEELPAFGKTVPGRMPNVRNSISNDGMRVFWSSKQGEGSHLYLRDVEKHETVQLDAPNQTETEKGFVPEGEPRATFQAASTDGSRVFFTDTQRVTEDSKAVGKHAKPDLYLYELGPPGSPLPGKLTDLTPEGINGESAALQVLETGFGGVIGASEDGTYVYFVADGALVPGASPGTCETFNGQARPELTCNLYEMHLNGQGKWETKLLAVLSSIDAPSWGGAGFGGDLGWMTARVSPNGRFLAFMSSRSLTGYNNEDQTSKAPGEKLDEETFLFDANQETLTCASCNPSGARPAGVFDPGRISGPEGVGLFVDRTSIWGERNVDHWLAGSVPGWTAVSNERALYQSRYLSDEGRLFFNSPDHLVAAATGAKEKVYQYEPTGLGGCTSQGGCIGLLSAPNSEGEPTGEHESAFVDASESGNDVFFVTTARLPAVNGTTSDVDSSYDLYDARVCQQSSPCLQAPPLGSPGCVNEASCKGAAPGTPGSPPPASMTASASGNVARIGTLPSKETSKPPPKKLTKAQLLAKALKACRTKYKSHSKRKQRTQCEKSARKRYAHASKHKKSHKASRARHGGGR